MNRFGTRQGQALIEWALLTPIYFLLFIGLFIFGEWFLIRQQLIMVTREGALLYSSGRVQQKEVKQVMRRALQKGHPALKVLERDIDVGRFHNAGGWITQSDKLDQVTIHYHPSQRVLRYFMGIMEESCVIKHAPTYWLDSNPPVPW